MNSDLYVKNFFNIYLVYFIKNIFFKKKICSSVFSNLLSYNYFNYEFHNYKLVIYTYEYYFDTIGCPILAISSSIVV